MQSPILPSPCQKHYILVTPSSKCAHATAFIEKFATTPDSRSLKEQYQHNKIVHFRVKNFQKKDSSPLTYLSLHFKKWAGIRQKTFKELL